MAKVALLEEEIKAVLSEHAKLKLAEIAGLLGQNSDELAVKRTLQRALKSLVESGIAVAIGNARSRVYVLASKIPSKLEKLDQELEKNLAQLTSISEITVNTQARSLFKYVNQPAIKRVPVGYNQLFLRSYQPNKSFYLSQAQRNELHKLGKVEASDALAGTYARDILGRLLIDLSWNSSRLEGNTYSLLETKRLIEYGEVADGKAADEAQMILNHKAAIEFLIDSADEVDFDTLTICNLHALLSDNLLGDPGASGRLRERPVNISGTTYLPLDNPYLLKECFDIFLNKINAIADPFEQCFFSLVHMSYLQAFEDVNKRTSRLSANIPLIKKNIKPLAFVDVDKDVYLKSLLGIYEKNDISLFRDLFIWAYRRSTQRYSAIQQSLGGPSLIKLKYRGVIQEIIKSIIKKKVPRKLQLSTIRNSVKKLNLASTETEKLVEIIELELSTLHEGNVARYQIKPIEFQEWKKLL